MPAGFLPLRTTSPPVSLSFFLCRRRRICLSPYSCKGRRPIVFSVSLFCCSSLTFSSPPLPSLQAHVKGGRIGRWKEGSSFTHLYHHFYLVRCYHYFLEHAGNTVILLGGWCFCASCNNPTLPPSETLYTYKQAVANHVAFTT